jgi:hypothetical protein
MPGRTHGSGLVCVLAIGLVSLGCRGTVNPPTTEAAPPAPFAAPAQPTPVQAASFQEIRQTAAQTPTSSPDIPAPSAIPETDPLAPLRRLHREAAARYAAIDSYIVRLRRREQVNGKDRPEEVLLFKFRKQPWSVYFKWLGTEATGREVIFVKGRFENKIHTRMAAGDMPLMPAGKRIALAPDNPLVRSSSRHSIEEAGIGVLIERMGALLDALDRGDHRSGSVRYLGTVKRPEFEADCEASEHTLPPGADPTLPRGGRRLCWFDPVTKFPVLLITYDDGGHEVEFYCYDRFEFPVRLDDDDFNPDKLWQLRR